MKDKAREWFENLRSKLISTIEVHENARFTEKKWEHSGRGGGLMSKIEGSLIEKGGVNISTVSGQFSEKMQKRVPGAEKDPSYWATGISVVLHPKNPNIPSMHFNTRYLSTTKNWFGGGIDITPCLDYTKETKIHHSDLKNICDKYDNSYYPKYKKWCDEYFFLKHRNEPRGIGGIFFDYLNTESDNSDFLFIKDVGMFFHDYVDKIISRYKNNDWSESDKYAQFIKRGRYVEFNLLYDRGTKFGLETGGNIDAILMSMPPQANWE